MICFKGGPEPSDVCLVNVKLKYFSKLCFGTSKFHIETKYWKTFLKFSSIDFSGQRRCKHELQVSIQFQSFLL